MKYLFTFFFISFSLSAFTQPFQINATADHSGGEYRIYRSQFTNNIQVSNIQNPIIFIEGFDPLNETSIAENYGLLNDGTLATQLHSLGYDIVVLNFNDGGDHISRNAMLLRDLINEINTNKPNNDELVVMGFSMGGLVARYALTQMEEDGIDHETRLYVSYDSPHKGAHVPVSVQAMVLAFNTTFLRLQFPEIEDQIESFQAPAAQEMLKYRLNSATDIEGLVSLSQTHVNFLNDINSLNSCNGFPRNTRNIGISLGSWSGIPQRANFDSDGDGMNDPQHSGFPMLFVNFPQGDHSGTTAIWNLNACQAVAAFSYQSYLSTAISYNYPEFENRFNYLGLGDYFYSTYWYRNSTGINLLPAGAWNRFYAYENLEDTDFAPGSFSNSYEEAVNGLNSEVNCSFNYYDNSTFVPTVSALNFDTHDLFYNIRDDANRLNRTPFDEIYGMDNENESHVDGQATNTNLVNWLINQIDGNHPAACLNDLTQVGYFGGGSNVETVASGQTRTISDATDIVSRNYHINSGATVSFTADNSILLSPGFHAKNGSSFTATLEPCSGKACSWTPYHTDPTQSLRFEIKKLQNPTCSNTCVGLVARIIGRNGNFTYEWTQEDRYIPCDPAPGVSCVTNTDIGSGKYKQVCYNNIGGPLHRTFRVEVLENFADGSSVSLGSYSIGGDAPCGGGAVALADEETEEIILGSEEELIPIRTAVYPNPSNEIFVLETSEPLAKVVVNDATGRTVKVQSTQGRINSIDLNRFENGVYFLNLTYENGKTEMLRVIKN